MKTSSKAPTTINEYIADFPRDVQTVLKRVREIIRKALPDAEEVISVQDSRLQVERPHRALFCGMDRALLPLPFHRPPCGGLQEGTGEIRGQWQGHDPVSSIRAGSSQADRRHREVPRQGSGSAREGQGQGAKKRIAARGHAAIHLNNDFSCSVPMAPPVGR